MVVNPSEDGTKSEDVGMLCQGTGYPWYDHIKQSLLGLHAFLDKYFFAQSFIQSNSKYVWQVCGALYERSHGGLNSVARYTPSIYPYGNTRKAIMQGGRPLITNLWTIRQAAITFELL